MTKARSFERAFVIVDASLLHCCGNNALPFRTGGVDGKHTETVAPPSEADGGVELLGGRRCVLLHTVHP